MPYRFKTNEPLEKGFRRIAREQLDAALAELTGAEVGPGNVHQCRKSLKRLRALVRLASAAIGDGKARRRTKSLGEIARLLSARRDQTVMLETIGKLSEGSPGAAETLAPLKASLAGPGQAADQPQLLDADIASRARSLLLTEAKKFTRIKFDKRGFAALAGGLEASYGQGRKAAKFAYEEPTDENFHDLRKAVQWHWRQMSLLARAWPDEFAVRVNAARELSQFLGDDHDLAMLIAATAKSTISEEEKEAAAAVCRRQQQILRATVEYRVKRLFAEKPEAFVSRMEAYWRCSRSLDPRLEVPPPVRQVPAADQKAVKETSSPVAAEEKRPAPAKPRLAAKSETPPASQRRA
jgi:CHAD domain-containing protein